MNKPILTSTLILLAVMLAGTCHAQVEWVTNTNDSGAGSLRAAVANVTNNGAVLFNSALFSSPQTIVLTSGEISSTLKSYLIVGPGADLLTISGNNASRVFNLIGPTGAVLRDMVELVGLTIANGRADGGGGILASGTDLSLTECRITNCDATDGGASPAGRGGGIHYVVTGFPSASEILMKNCCVDGNRAGTGGGVAVTGNATLAARLTFMVSTFSGNQALGSGSSGGGGLAVEAFAGAATDVTVFFCTVTANSASAGQGGGILGFGVAPSIRLRSGILAGNSAPTGPDGFSSQAFVVFSYNLIGNDAGGPFGSGLGSLIGTTASPIDPLLGPLQNNGGPTPTHALQAGAPGIDYVRAGNTQADQRGFTRDTLHDIGAYEFGASASGGGGPPGPAGPPGADGDDGSGCMAGAGGSLALLLLLLLPLLARRRRRFLFWTARSLAGCPSTTRSDRQSEVTRLG